MPGSLAILQATFRREDRAPAIGLWSGLAGVATAVGPFVGGYFIQAVSWRLIFLINLPLVLAVVWISLRHVPETRDDSAAGRLDTWGAALAAIGLGSLVFGVIEGPARGWSSTLVVATFVTAAVALLGFIALESRLQHPMLPLSIFRSRQFAGANAATLLIYAAVYGTLFLIPLQLQQVLGYSPLEAGIALLPITAVMLVLSPWAGRLSQRIGPRLPMTAGPLLAAVGLILLSMIQAGSGYVTAFLPAVTVFSLGLALTVSPLTAAVLAAAPREHAGLASAINNTAARAAGVIAVAALPVAVGLTGAAYLEPATFAGGYKHAMWLAAALCAAGGVVAYATMESVCVLRKLAGFSCPLDAPPLVADDTRRA